MKTLHLLLVLPCLAASPPVTGQDDEAKTAPAVQEDASEADELFERLSNAYDEAKDRMSAERARLRAEAEAAGKKPVYPDDLYDEQERLIGLLHEGARTYAGTDGAVPFLVWRIMERPRSSADAELITTAVRTLRDTHIKSRKLVAILPVLSSLADRVNPGDARSFSAALEEHSPVPELRTMARFVRLLEELEAATYGTEAYDALSKEALAAAEATGEKRLTAKVERAIELASKFSIGMVAPDIEGVDLSNVAFKLSDYEGKVIFLDFWGDW